MSRNYCTVTYHHQTFQQSQVFSHLQAIPHGIVETAKYFKTNAQPNISLSTNEIQTLYFNFVVYSEVVREHEDGN